MVQCDPQTNNRVNFFTFIVGLQPTVIASRAPHLLLEQRIVDVRRPSITFTNYFKD